MNSGKLDVQKSEFDLSQLLEELVRNIMPVLNSAGCTVHMDIVDSLIGNWDRFRIEQVVSNLLNNAIKYSSGSPLWISLKKLRGRAILTVRDGGKGIAPENHEKIFQRFERATSNEDIRGLGLGLYICREIVESHQGTIRVESELGKGASFIIDLPLFSSDQGSKIDLQPQIAVKL
jgi:signal transduction histidine kinase